MAADIFQNKGGQSVGLVVLFLMSLLSPLLMNPVGEPSLDESDEMSFSGPFTQSSGYGHDLAGSVIDVDGLVGATVREESMLDAWQTEMLNVSFGEHHGTPDMKLTRHDKAHLCWSTQEGTVRTAVYRPTGVWSTSLVDTVATSNASDLVDCAVGVTANELPRVLYADGADLKMGRYALQSATYYDGPRWHTRTIMEDVAPTHLALDITPEGLEWGLMRTATGALHQVNFSGAYWTDSLLDSGPVGENFELQLDDNGVAHVLYTLVSTGEVVLLRIDGMDHDRRSLLQDDNLADVLGMGLDANNIEQVATATQSSSAFSINLIRSLAGQDTGRVNPVPSTALEGDEDKNEGLMLTGDLNADGFDDLVISTPEADEDSMIGNGRVSVHYGSATGLSDLPDITYAGTSDGAHFGAGMDLGDFNNDGIMDLAVGSPGWAPANDPEARHGFVHVYLGNASGLPSSPWSTLSGEFNESLGSAVEALHHTGSGSSLAATARNYTSEVSETQTLNGKVNLYAGNESGLFPSRNLTQTEDGGLFGRSLEACDVNADGHDELIVGNTGDYSQSTTYSSVEYYFGSSSGYNGTADHTLVSIVQGKLFGLNIACVGDLNGDGFDEHIISEPYNSSEGFGAGTLWLFEGTNGPLPGEADWRYWPPPSSRIGDAMAAAGDINEDGYDDVYISSRMGNAAGRVEIFLGSPTGISEDRQLLAEGNSSEQLGFRMASGGDVNGDGLSDLFFSMRSQERGEAFALTYLMLSEQDWESISFQRQGTVFDVQLGTAGRGETSIVYTHADAMRLHVSKLEHMNDGTPGGQWVDQTLASLNTTHLGVAFDVRSSGQPVVVIENTSSMMLASTTSLTALHQAVATTGTMGQWLGSSATHDNKQVLAYTSGVGNQIFSATQTPTGWSSELVRGQADLAQAIDVNVDSLNTPHLVYRLAGTNQLELAVGGSSWTFTSLGAQGEARSYQHPTLVLDNDSVAVGLVASNGSGTNLEVWIHDGAGLSKHTIANHSELTSELGLAVLDNGSLLVAALTNDGTLRVFEQWPGTHTWTEHTVPQPSGTANEYRLDMKGGTSPVIAVRANAISSILGLNETGAWVSLAERPAAALNGAWDVHHSGDHLLLMTTDPVSNHLVFNSVELNSTTGESNPWMSVRFGDIVANHRVHSDIDDNGTVHMAFWDEVNDDVIMLRLYRDADRDLVFDIIDAMPSVGDQWMNSDSDAYGDNPLGPLPDACPTDTGSSSFIFHGCDDYDTDGYRDDIDDCDDQGGTSWIDRFGCQDLDQDGWSDNDASYLDGDVFKTNWKQALDTDGDGFGDNHGVDCCAVPELDPNAGPGDLFPYIGSQYTDFDGDGYGDNDTDTVHGDYCPWDYGTSFRDRNGCLDSDADGASDPSGEGSIFEWNATVHGADVWPFDATQWKDTDGDGYGDNQSENATNPDRFPLRMAAANDTDDDGFADNWTEYYNGSNAQGIFIDACPTEEGNSSRRNLTVYAYGCPDADGDGYTDAYVFDVDPDTGLRINELGDAFPDEKTQSKDKDGDGFGDNPIGVDGDKCPEVPGVLNGTDGVGCRVIDANDDDGDGLINELDLICPNTPLGEQVNEEGCSQSELDDDEDGVKNNADACPGTVAGSIVDAQGCSEDQRNSDTDGDGLNDPDDNCPNTAEGMEVDENGCSQAQRDSDGDGLSDLDDACDDTPPGFPILANGCTDESALDTDLDGDGYSGVYTYDIDPTSGLHVNQTGDAFPSDATQWFDQDGDGYGDNPSPANNADDCPAETGTSYIRFLGCYDDGDGYRDEDEPEALRGDPTQWRDSDYDGYGDNWGDPAWNATRDPSWPGQFVAGATNADFCPETTPGLLPLDDEGCHISERDSDFDGVMDDEDNCPNEAKGVDGYEDGCPKISASSDGEGGLFAADSSIIMLALGGLGGVLIVSLLVVRLLRREDDDDDEDYDDFYDDEEEESILDTMDRAAATPQRSRPTPQRTSSPAAQKGPSGPGPNRQAPTRQAGPPGRAASGPPRGGGGPPGRGPSQQPSPSKAKSPQKAGKKKVVRDEEPGKKVRKAKINVDMSIFEDWQADDREAAVDWVAGAFTDGDQERAVLMQLQETGWTAEQSRAICSLAKNKRS